MNPWLVVPVKPIEAGKSRLALHIGAAGRRSLDDEFLARTLSLASRYPGIGRTVVVSRCKEVLAAARKRGAVALPEDGDGMNEAVEQATAWVNGFCCREILVMSCDLPYAHAGEVKALVDQSRAMRGGVVVATDRRSAGTNALCLPAGVSFKFAFGPASRLAHVQQALQLRLPCCVAQRPSLAFDVDTVEDYRAWRHKTS